MHRQILGYSRRDSASSMFANNAIDIFDALLRKNIFLLVLQHILFFSFKTIIYKMKTDIFVTVVFVTFRFCYTGGALRNVQATKCFVCTTNICKICHCKT